MKPRKIPRGTFWIGAAVGLALGLPLLVMAFELLSALLSIGDPGTSLRRLLAISLIFAGFPAVIGGGGVARLTAHRLAERARTGRTHNLSTALRIASIAMSAAGAALAILIAVPVGGMPDTPIRWTIIVAAGAIAGGATGVAIGAMTGLRVGRFLSRQA
jgi:hypothetical protein